ncbi:MAG: hypothetical protein ACLP50_12300 [Solirubrobacteraceae bacterium]|jgi:hypothetical protein
MAFTLITITASDEQPDGRAASGTLTMTLTEQIQNGTQEAVATPIAASIAGTVVTDTSTGLPLAVIANNDPATVPQGSQYQVVLNMDSAPLRSGLVTVPYSAVGQTIDLSALLPSP